MLKHILIPLDGSDIAEKALPYAEQIIQPPNTITLLTALDVPDYPATLFYPAGIATYELNKETMEEQIIPQARDYLEKIKKSLQENGFTVQIKTVIGEPASTIVKEAIELQVDAIVMSTHGRSGISRWLFGSVAIKVLGLSCCPVFVVPAKAKEKSK